MEENEEKEEKEKEEKILWTEEQVKDYFGDEATIKELLEFLAKEKIPSHIYEDMEGFLEMLDELKGNDKRCEYRHGGMCSIKRRPCMYKSRKTCLTYKNRGRHFLLSDVSEMFGVNALDLLTAHPFFEPMARALDKILSDGSCPKGVALAFCTLDIYLLHTIEDEMEEMKYLKR